MSNGSMAVVAKLGKYLKSKMPEAEDLEVVNISGVAFGASRETFVFDVKWKDGGVEHKQGMVLRRDPPSGLLDHITRETEYRILQALDGSGIPAPRVYWCESDPGVLDRPFIIMERVEGNVNPAFQAFGRGNETLRNQIAEQFVEILARIHGLDWRARGLEFLGVPQGPLGYAEQELAKWEGILDQVKLEPDLVLTEALLWLHAHLPPAAETCLVHGDYKLDNVMYKKDKVLAVFDWEMATLGDPHDDLGWVCSRFYEVEGLINGLMERDWFLCRYQEVSGREVNLESVRFWQVFSNLKMAVIALTGGQRFVSGASRKNTLALLPLLLAKLHQDIIELLEF